MAGVYFFALQEGGGQLGEVARTFGVDWPHLLAQIVSFGIVCVVLQRFAFKPVLAMLAARREQIAAGLANAAAIKAELARTEVARREVLAKADAEGRRLIDEARAAAVRAGEEETQRARAAAELVVTRATEATERDRSRMRAELKREVGRLVIQTTASVAGKVLTAEDHSRLVDETTRQLPV
jgi:F-type H+-transporting ATPase subunit b